MAVVRRQPGAPTVFILVALLLSACGNHVYHRVERGDSLYSIGLQYDQDYRQVAAWNNIKPPYVLAPGQWLRVAPPLQGARPVPVVAATPGKSKTPVETAAPVITASPPMATKPSPVTTPQAWQWPARGELVRTFAADEPGKKGVAISGRLGQPIWSAAAGRVVYGGSGLAAYGNLLIIKHDANYLTAYAHNHKLRVQEGDTVTAGQHIADMGKSGAEQVMLHFEIRYQGKPVDPLRYLPAITP